MRANCSQKSARKMMERMTKKEEAEHEENIQILPAHYCTVVRFVLTEGQTMTKPVVCWAWSE